MFGFISKTKAATVLLNALQRVSMQSFTIPYSAQIYNVMDTAAQLSAYVSIDDLYAIVNKIDSICKQVPLYVYNVADKKSFDKYRVKAEALKKNKQYTRKNIFDLAELQSKALEMAGDGDPLQKLLDHPNDAESKDEFFSGLYSFPLITGNDFIVMDKYRGGLDLGKPFQLFHLSPAYVSILPSTTLPREALQYKYLLYSTQLFYERDEILHRKYFNPIYAYNGMELYGLSPLQCATRLLEQLKNERDYANNSLMNAGAEGFLNNDDAEFDLETYGAVKNEIIKELGAVRDRNGSNINAKKLGLLLGKWKYNQIGINPADMNLAEQSKLSFKKLCNIYGVSDRLFNNDATGSEVSIDRMLRDAFITVAIPEVAGVRDMFNEGLTPYFSTPGALKYIDYDISQVTQIQEDINAIITRYANAPAFRVNDLFEETGWGRLDDPNANVVMIKTGYEPLSEATQTFAADLSGLNDYTTQPNP